MGLPFDPDLFDHMVEHGVYIETPEPNPALPVINTLARLIFPITFSILLIKVAFRCARGCEGEVGGEGGVDHSPHPRAA